VRSADHGADGQSDIIPDRPLRPQLLAGAHRLAVRGSAGDGHDRSARPVDVHAHRRHRRSRGRDRAGAAGDGARLRPGGEPFVKDSSLTQSAPASRDLGQARAGSPAIMAVINRTTDSFYESAATFDEAIAAVEAAAADGAQIVDIGGVRAGRGRVISVAEASGPVGPPPRGPVPLPRPPGCPPPAAQPPSAPTQQGPTRARTAPATGTDGARQASTTGPGPGSSPSPRPPGPPGCPKTGSSSTRLR